MSEGILIFETTEVYEILPLRDFVAISEYIQSYIVLVCNTITLCISITLFFYAYAITPPDARKKMKIKKWMNVNFKLTVLSFLARTSILGVYSNEDGQVLSNLVSLFGIINALLSSLHMHINSSYASYNAIKKNEGRANDEEDQQIKDFPAFVDSFALSPTSYGNATKDA
ncbi:hypothetical protein PS6_001587 [Mucor atramentarius]